MEQNKALSTVEQNALQVKYEICGTAVELDIDFVKKYLVRGRSELVTDSSEKGNCKRAQEDEEVEPEI